MGHVDVGGAPRLGVPVPRGTTVEEHMVLFGRLSPQRGAMIRLDMGSRRGTTPPKDVTVHNGDLWRAYKRTRAHNQGRQVLARQGKKESSAVSRQTKRASSLKEPSRSTWEDLCCLEVDSLDKDGQVSLGLILAKFENRSVGGMCEAYNQNRGILRKRRETNLQLEARLRCTVGGYGYGCNRESWLRYVYECLGEVMASRLSPPFVN
jgi:hypothetical protein